MLSKDQLIDGIRELNATAEPSWLEYFDASSLQRYLDHLSMARQPRGRLSRWVRESDAPAVVTRRPAE